MTKQSKEDAPKEHAFATDEEYRSYVSELFEEWRNRAEATEDFEEWKIAEIRRLRACGKDAVPIESKKCQDSGCQCVDERVLCQNCRGSGLEMEGWPCEECDGYGYLEI